MNKVIKNKTLKFSSEDLFLFIILATTISLYILGSHGMHQSYHQGESINISLSAYDLPYDTLRTTMRLFIGMIWSFAFAIVAGVLAAKNKHFERVILPFINFMESVPLVGFLTFSTAFFMSIYHGSLMGIEAAAIFGVFTGQAWNMALTLYQSLKTIPNELKEAADNFSLNAWQRFIQIELPFAIPGLLWNTMVSQSAAWFALVATEAIPMGSQTLYLPGIGSYIQIALDQANYLSIIYALIALILNIILLDQFVFRPLVRWSEKFKYERTNRLNHNTSWFYQLSIKSIFFPYILKKIALGFIVTGFYIKKLGITLKLNIAYSKTKAFIQEISPFIVFAWYGFLAIILSYCGYFLWNYLPSFNVAHMSYLMLLTTLRVFAAMILSLIIFVPLGIYIGISPKRIRLFQPIIQIMAAVPPNIFYPLIAIFLIAFNQSLSWWAIVLTMMGTQWYILFNVIAGVSTMPEDIRDLMRNFSIKGFYAWRKVIIPSIFPFIVTGIISGAGGAWNADIMAEVVQWGNTTLHTTGLGAFVNIATASDDQTKQAALGCILMCLLVGLCIVFIWKPLYQLAEKRYRF